MAPGRWTRYRTDRTDIAAFTGGADELSNVLRSEATNDPARFARLALPMTADALSAYVGAILFALMQTQNPIDASLAFDVVRHVATFGDDGNDQALVMALRRHLSGDVPDDIIELVLDRALHATDPAEDAWSKPAPNGGTVLRWQYLGQRHELRPGAGRTHPGDLLIYDADGHRTQLVVPSLPQLASDPSVAVRSSVAHVLAASLRRAPDEALAAFDQLIAADDRLLATNNLINLMSYIGPGRPAVGSRSWRDRAHAGLSARERSAVGRVPRRSGRARVRPGAPPRRCPRVGQGIHPHRSGRPVRPDPAYTSDAVAASSALQQFLYDEDEEVRKAAAWVVAELRDKPLQPFRELLKAVVASPTSPRRWGS